MFDSDDVPVHVQRHLVRVYGILTLTLLSAVIGVFIHFVTNIGGQLTGVASILLMILIGVSPKPSSSSSSLSTSSLSSLVKSLFSDRRLLYLCALGVMQGLSVGPLIHLAMRVTDSSRLVITSLIGTTLVFVCFSASALLARRRSYLSLSAFCSSLLSLLLFLSFVSLVWSEQSAWIRTANIYLGLVLFSAYVLYDTQVIIEKAANHDDDAVMHAVTLFVDFIGIFVRVLLLLLQNQKRRDEKETASRARANSRSSRR